MTIKEGGIFMRKIYLLSKWLTTRFLIQKLILIPIFFILFGQNILFASPNVSLAFNGTTNYVNCGTNPSLDFGLNDFTISAWIKIYVTDNNEYMIYSAHGASPVYMEIYQRRLSMTVGNTWVQSQEIVADGAWHHVAGVVDRDTGITLYIDGTQVKSINTPQSSLDLNFSNDIYLGRYSGGGYYFKGGIAETNVYNRALSSGEIHTLSGEGEINTGLIAKWKMNEGSGNTILDSFSDNNGSINGDAFWTGRVIDSSLWKAAPSVSLLFNGTTDYVELSNASNFSPGTNDFSISLWMRTSVTDNGEHMLFSAQGNTPVYLEVYEKRINMSVGNVWLEHSQIVADGAWHHIVGVMDRDKGIIIYVDGISETGSKQETTDLQFTNNGYLGRYSGGGYYFEGEIGNVNLFNKTLTNNEIGTLYNGGKITSALSNGWDIDEGSGLTINAASGNNNGIINGADWIKTPTTSINFDGVNDYVEITNNSLFSPGTGDMSISAWIKTSVTDNGEYMIVSAHGNKAVYLEIYQNKIGFAVGDSYVQNDIIVTDGAWHYVTAVLNKTQGITVYVDGKSVTGNSNESTDLQFTSNLYIGKYSGNGYYWNGEIIDVSMYNKALNKEEALSLYADNYPTNGLIARWEGLPGTGNVLDDTGKNNLNGTIHGAEWTGGITPKTPATSLLFDGNDYIDVGTASSLDPGTNNFSISLWIKTNVSDNGEYMIYSANGTKDVYLEMYQKRIGLSIGGNYFLHSANVSDGEWHYITAVMDRDTGIKIYVDGMLETGGNADTTDLKFTSDVYIGKYSGENYYWNGEIADINVFNRALDNQDILNLYGGNGVTNGLVSKWSELPGIGNIISDETGNNTGTIHGAEWIGGVHPKTPATSLLFDGNDYIDVGTANSLDPGTNDFSISLWIKTNVSDNGEYMIYSANGTKDVYLEMYQKRIGLSIGGNYFLHSANVSDGAWHYITAVMDRDTGIKIYVDGMLETGGNADTTDLKFTSDVYIGKYSGGNYYWKGEIGNISYYNRALTSEDMGNLYAGNNVTNNLVSNWPGNFGDTSLIDTVSGNNGAIHGALWSTAEEYYETVPYSIKRRNVIENNHTVTYEYLNENWNNLGYGRYTLINDSTSGIYKTYDWAETTVTLKEYTGVYTVTQGSPNRSGVNTSNLRIEYLFKHNEEMVNIVTSTNGWLMQEKTVYKNDGVSTNEKFLYYSSKRMNTFEQYSAFDIDGDGISNENPDDTTKELYGKHIKYYYYDEDTGTGYGRIYRIDNITDNWYYDLTYINPLVPTDSTLKSKIKKNITTGDVISQIESYNDGLIKRNTADNDDITEYLYENYNSSGKGRVTLFYNSATSNYKTYEWGASQVTITEYNGAYTPSSGSTVWSDIIAGEKIEKYKYTHNNEEVNLDTTTNDWRMSEKTIYTNSGNDISQQYFYYSSGKLQTAEKDNETTQGDFYGKHVKYYYNDENAGSGYGRIYRIDNYTDNWYYTYTFASPSNPLDNALLTMEKRNLSNSSLIIQRTYYSDSHLLHEEIFSSADSYGNSYYQRENNNFYGNGQYGRILRIQRASDSKVTKILSWRSGTDTVSKEEEFTNLNETTWVETRWKYENGNLYKSFKSSGEAAIYFNTAGYKTETFWNSNGSITHWASANEYNAGRASWYLESTQTVLELYSYWDTGNLKFKDTYINLNGTWKWYSAYGYNSAGNNDGDKTQAETNAPNTYTLPEKPDRMDAASLNLGEIETTNTFNTADLGNHLNNTPQGADIDEVISNNETITENQKEFGSSVPIKEDNNNLSRIV
ncbi:Pentaxin [Candidatus Omnitrophus magneticus]|uniref:Pentaxin n=1 Tax=Candidatus Omnitrophus magneticus TaxID=1609969 RepID=A0A0F0CV47_9BACT|nr:Pentaxin [Candidatus Omnitrophus magneticus]